METRRLGSSGPAVSALGLGCMGMSDAYGPADRSESLATLHAALDAGITLFDTGDFYGSGGNELLLGEAFTGVPRNRYQLSVKFGGLRDPNGGWGPVDGRPASIRNFLAYSLKRLRVDYIDVYRAARLDPTVPIEETIGALSDCVQMGWIRYVGLSEVGAETLRRAHVVHPIADLQIEYSLLTRDIESAILPTCRELGIGITAYGVLSRGLLSGFRINGDQDVPRSNAQVPRRQSEVQSCHRGGPPHDRLGHRRDNDRVGNCVGTCARSRRCSSRRRPPPPAVVRGYEQLETHSYERRFERVRAHRSNGCSPRSTISRSHARAARQRTCTGHEVLMIETFDAIVIGAGQAGPALATKLVGTGLSVAVVERKLGLAHLHSVGDHKPRRAVDFGVVASTSVKVDLTARKVDIGSVPTSWFLVSANGH